MELKRDITQGLFLLKKKQRRHSPIIQDLTRLNKIAIQTTSSRWQVDKEAIGLSRVQQFYHLCVARPYKISDNSFSNIF